MFEDLARGAVLEPARPEAAAAERARPAAPAGFVSYADWLSWTRSRSRAGGRRDGRA